MSRLQQRFADLKAQSRTALIPYITAGDPNPDATVPIMHALVAAGADVLELGVPFSDPMADGPVIQAACERALKFGTGLKDVLKMVEKFRQDDAQTPVVLMGYMNPIESFGLQQFSESAKNAGVDAILAVDLGIEEAPDVAPVFAASGLDCVYLLAPTTSPERMAQICEQAKGFIYYVSLKGVTGAASLNTASLAGQIAQIRKHSGLPVGVGFGISTPQDAAAVSQVADAVVVGSALIRLIAACADGTEDYMHTVPALLAEMRQAMDASHTGVASSAQQMGEGA